MLTVKFLRYADDSVNIFEGDQVYVSESPYQSNPDLVALDVHIMDKGDEKALIVLDDSNYHWDVAYVENSMGKTIQTIRPQFKPKVT